MRAYAATGLTRAGRSNMGICLDWTEGRVVRQGTRLVHDEVFALKAFWLCDQKVNPVTLIEGCQDPHAEG
jgi:hypothetical protein